MHAAGRGLPKALGVSDCNAMQAETISIRTATAWSVPSHEALDVLVILLAARLWRSARTPLLLGPPSGLGRLSRCNSVVTDTTIFILQLPYRA